MKQPLSKSNTARTQNIDPDEIKQEFQAIPQIYEFTFYTLFIFCVSVLDYVFYSMFQNGYNQTWFFYTWMGITIIQIIDFIVLIIRNKKHQISFINASFVMYLLPIISISVCVILYIVHLAHGNITETQVMKAKMSQTVFNRGLILTVKSKQSDYLNQGPISGKTAKLIYAKDFTVVGIFSFYPFICFLTIFMGFFQLLEFNSLEILYFLVVTMSTLGYGDITYSSSMGRLLVMIFIITAIIYVPVEITTIIQYLAQAIPEISIKSKIANGILIIGKYDKSIAAMMRLKLPQNVNVVYVVTGEQEQKEGLAFQSSPTFAYAFYPEFTKHVAEQLCIQRAKSIIIVSQEYSSKSDIEAINVTQVVTKQTRNNVEANVVLNSSQYYQLAKKIFRGKRNCNFICFEDIFGVLSYLSVKYEGFQTFFYNILNKQDDKFELNTWIQESKEEIQLQQTLQVDINAYNTLRSAYNSSLQWKLSSINTNTPKDEEENEKSQKRLSCYPIGVDFYIAFEKTKQPRDVQQNLYSIGQKFSNQQKNYVGTDFLQQNEIQKVGVVLFKNCPFILAHSMIQRLKGIQITVYQQEEHIKESQNVKTILYQQENQEILKQLKQTDVTIVMHSDSNHYRRDDVYSMNEYIKSLELKKIITVSDYYPDDFREAKINQLFRTSQLIPFMRAYMISTMCKDFKLLNIGLFLLNEIESGKTFLKQFKIEQPIQVGAIMKQGRILYVKYKGTIINVPEPTLYLQPDDLICVIGWLDEDEVFGKVEDILQRRTTGLSQISQISLLE
ncbi:Ion_transport 2 and transmembrane domain-containing protein [Hexamita inflata]|uniref:Ion transport 2 and transmembrane domain-containing protein n=1 Tax=Hexamita inflata TaxID=28002 RepID=A0AA86UT20_9EUKA|nr:Ion transport 2 and transmembrane domain-containing protein [Hexamita inflata]